MAAVARDWNPWGASLPESVQYIVFDFLVPKRRTYDARGRRLLRDTMDSQSETLCDERVESSPLWGLRLRPAVAQCCAARATGKAFYAGYTKVAVARAAALLATGDYVAALTVLGSLANIGSDDGHRPFSSVGSAMSDATRAAVLATVAGARLAVRGRDPKARLPAARALDEARAAVRLAPSLGPAHRTLGLALATFQRHTESAVALDAALADPMVAAGAGAAALAADAAAQRALAAGSAERQVTLLPSGPWVEGAFGASRVVALRGDAGLQDLLAGVDESHRLRLIDAEGRALHREWTPSMAGVADGATLLVAENDRRSLRQRRPDTYQTPAETERRRGNVLDDIRRRQEADGVPGGDQDARDAERAPYWYEMTDQVFARRTGASDDIASL
jgi:hypothetical protein